MEAETNYWVIWVIYLTVSSLFFAFFWWLTQFQKMLWTAYCLRAVIAAIILTPWYASGFGTALAPAWIIILLDVITIGNDAAVRATIPLILAIICSVILATGVYYINKKYYKTIS